MPCRCLHLYPEAFAYIVILNLTEKYEEVQTPYVKGPNLKWLDRKNKWIDMLEMVESVGNSAT
jgi:hypothetical protein